VISTVTARNRYWMTKKRVSDGMAGCMEGKFLREK